MLDVLSKVKQAEDAAQQLLSDAQQKAVAIRADAQRQGKTILDNAKADAAKLSEETVSRAQQDAQVCWKIPVPRVKTSARRMPKDPGRS